MPSSRKERDTVLNIIKDYAGDSRFIDSMTVLDLGSGWGGLARDISRTLKTVQVTAMELSLLPHIYSRIISFFCGYKKISHSRNNFLKNKLKSRTIYVCYLSGPVMKKLRHRFETDLPKDGLLISIAFAMPAWTPQRVEYAGAKLCTPVYVYEF